MSAGVSYTGRADASAGIAMLGVSSREYGLLEALIFVRGFLSKTPLNSVPRQNRRAIFALFPKNAKG